MGPGFRRELLPLAEAQDQNLRLTLSYCRSINYEAAYA
jgi:hypothetical protein